MEHLDESSSGVIQLWHHGSKTLGYFLWCRRHLQLDDGGASTTLVGVACAALGPTALTHDVLGAGD